MNSSKNAVVRDIELFKERLVKRLNELPSNEYPKQLDRAHLTVTNQVKSIVFEEMKDFLKDRVKFAKIYLPDQENSSTENSKSKIYKLNDLVEMSDKIRGHLISNGLLDKEVADVDKAMGNLLKKIDEGAKLLKGYYKKEGSKY